MTPDLLGPITDRIDKPALLAAIRARFAIDFHGVHGVRHWARVRINGLAVAAECGANPHVVELFAFFHDSCRRNEHIDPGHGARGADLAHAFRGRYFTATDAEMSWLTEACTLHTDGHTVADVTVQACWDADRLDLARCGIHPDAKYLCTPIARTPETIAKAVARSRGLR